MFNECENEKNVDFYAKKWGKNDENLFKKLKNGIFPKILTQVCHHF